MDKVDGSGFIFGGPKLKPHNAANEPGRTEATALTAKKTDNPSEYMKIDASLYIAGGLSAVNLS